MTPLDPLFDALIERITDAVAAKLRDSGKPARQPDRLLSLDEAAAMLGMDVKALRRRAPRLPFAKKVGHRTWGFRLSGLQRWMVEP